MKLAWGIAASLAAASIAVGFASPASADATDDVVGTFSMNMGGTPSTWTVTPCDPDPANQPFIPCAHVADSGGTFKPWQADAHFSVGFWTMAAERSDAIQCDDGSTLPAKVNYWWNPVSLQGQLGFFFPGGCGDAPAGSLFTPFVLTRTGGPAPAPADV